MARQLNSMPSKKKARGKARRATKSRKAKEDVAVNGIDSEMQRLQIGSSERNQEVVEDEDALLEEAINLAVAEKEELEAAAKIDKANISEECFHGFDPLPENHVCVAFIYSFCNEFNVCLEGNQKMTHIFEHIYEATKTKYAEVWNDSDMIQWVASHFIMKGAIGILEGNHNAVRRGAMCSSFLEQWATIVVHAKEAPPSWDIFAALFDWTKMCELFDGDEHTLVSFFRKRIPCKCLDNKYEEVKSITKIGRCHNPNCSLPLNEAVRSKMLYCTQCRRANYCSRECQVAHWPSHKHLCIVHARMFSARKSRQKG